ncbi:MAG: hypothetical protein U5L09_05155 [Bacteroidales bacterium]|nr:hypothetical protein [Bacteroidales bacterium]
MNGGTEEERQKLISATIFSYSKQYINYEPLYLYYFGGTATAFAVVLLSEREGSVAAFSGTFTS